MGELKKRLSKILEEETGTTDSGYLAELLKPIDEAKKDYVKPSSKWNKENQGSYDMDGLVHIFEEWFEKWFGSNEET